MCSDLFRRGKAPLPLEPPARAHVRSKGLFNEDELMQRLPARVMHKDGEPCYSPDHQVALPLSFPSPE